MFRMKILNQLNGRQREEVRDLENLCRKTDKIQGGISLKPEDAEENPVYYMGYEDELLAGFAIMYFMPGRKAEVCGYVHPEYRRRAVYKKLLGAIKKEAGRARLAESYVVHEPFPSDQFAAFAEEGHLRYMHSEYLMEWKYSYPLLPTNTLTVLPVAEDSMQPAAELLNGAFLLEPGEAEGRIRLFLEEGYEYYSVWEQKALVGIFGLAFGEESVYLFDFAVDGDSQGRGVGKAMMKELIRLVQAKSAENGIPDKKIRLQVGSKNETAFRFYQKNGFQVVSQRDYYLILLNKEEVLIL